jgi:hypothetical protein
MHHPGGSVRGSMWQRLDDAASLLGIRPGTLEAWEKRYGFPKSEVGEDGELLYSVRDLEALRGALASELSIPNAIAAARRRSAVHYREGGSSINPS